MRVTPNTHVNKMLHQAGFSLVEIMVGLVIGLLATLVIMNVFSVFEGQKRTTTGNADTQTNGAIALYNLQRDVPSAGYGLPVFGEFISPFNCPVNTTFNHDNDATTPAINLSPIVITDGVGANGSDTISIHNGDSMRGGIPFDMQPLSAGNSVVVENQIGCAVNDVALTMAQPTSNLRDLTCTMTRVTALPITPLRITLAATTPEVAFGNSMACMGVWNEIQYTVNANNQLTRSGNITAGVPSAAAVPIVTEIVNMQAQYGITDPPNFALEFPYTNQVTQWVNATGIWAATATTPTIENRNRIRAIRVAVVARNSLLESTNVTTACSSLSTANPTGLCAWDGSIGGSAAPIINLAADANWQRYRYRVYETIIPIKNLIWSRIAL